jgi:hypothetical protein
MVAVEGLFGSFPDIVKVYHTVDAVVSVNVWFVPKL